MEPSAIPAGGPSGARYDGEPQVPWPVLPFRLWGLDFDEEMLFELRSDPRYAMVEVARVFDRAGQERFFALLAEHDGKQTVIVGDDEAWDLAETFPAPRFRGALRVVRLASEERVEYDAAFKLPDGRLLQFTAHSPRRGQVPGKRNGNAMNHSADRVMAVIDLEESNWTRPAVFIEGSRVPVRWLAPFVPFAWRLQQTAGGFSFGGVNMAPADGAGAAGATGGAAGGSPGPFLAAWIDDTSAPIPFEIHRNGKDLDIVGRDRLVDLVYRFEALSDRGLSGPVELKSAEVRHGATRPFHVEFRPWLPDLRWPLRAKHESTMYAGSNGQMVYMQGKVETWFDGERPVLDLRPLMPFWACERPIRNRFQFLGDRVRLRAEVTPEIAAGGLGADACYEQED
jgi:hypothetical protein